MHRGTGGGTFNASMPPAAERIASSSARRGLRPGSAMPDLGVGDDEAQQIAAYLATFRKQP